MFVDAGEMGYQTVLVKGAQLGPHWGGAEENLCKAQCCAKRCYVEAVGFTGQTACSPVMLCSVRAAYLCH
jgi:hypothetical protein